MYQKLENITVLLSRNLNTTHLTRKGVVETPCVGLWFFIDSATACHLRPHDNLVGLCHEPKTRKIVLISCSQYFIKFHLQNQTF